MSRSTALVRRSPSDLSTDPLDPSEFNEDTTALASGSDDETALAPYAAPVPGKTWRSLARFSVLVGGSAGIGIAVAGGGLTFAGAALLAVGLATGQVLAQTWRQNRLGQAVVGGISLGDLDTAQQAAELALTESPAGVMRTLAASNLASVLIQRDRLDDAARILDKYPPGVFAMPLATVLWLNNRAFAHLALDDDDGRTAAGPLLEDAERRLGKASARDLGGPQNSKKLLAAVCGTRAIERAAHRDGRAALAYLERARQVDDGPSTAYRTVERELCRAEALRLVGRMDEAIVSAESLMDTAMTERQKKRAKDVAARLGLA
jgi:hypothetical protein